jgi:hypothetical protein
MSGAQCPGVNASGDPCGNPPRTGREWCIWHDPERQGEAKRLRARGGNQRKRKDRRVVMPEDLPAVTSQEQCEEALAWLFAQVGTGKLDPTTAKSMTSVVRALHGAIGTRLGLEKRANALERRLRDLGKVDT